MEYNDFIFCPLVDKKIDVVDCMENRDTKEEVIPAIYKVKTNWKEICDNCPYSKY